MRAEQGQRTSCGQLRLRAESICSACPAETAARAADSDRGLACTARSPGFWLCCLLADPLFSRPIRRTLHSQLACQPGCAACGVLSSHTGLKRSAWRVCRDVSCIWLHCDPRASSPHATLLWPHQSSTAHVWVVCASCRGVLKQQQMWHEILVLCAARCCCEGNNAPRTPETACI